MYLYSVDITLVVMYLNVEIFRVLIYFTWSALNNYLTTEQMVIYIYIFFCNLIVKIVMEHLFYFAFLDLESLKFSENFKGNFARQILWTFFLIYHFISFSLILSCKKEICAEQFLFQIRWGGMKWLGQTCPNGFDRNYGTNVRRTESLFIVRPCVHGRLVNSRFIHVR